VTLARDIYFVATRATSVTWPHGHTAGIAPACYRTCAACAVPPLLARYTVTE